jgi:alpha-D-ribose 1-methylphosphonate 5-triphosphate diphosphatase PhnM
MGEKTSTQLGPLERANLSHWTHLHLRTETDPVSETSCFLEYRTMEKVQKNSVNSVQHTPSSESFQVNTDYVSYLSLLNNNRSIEIYRNDNYNNFININKINAPFDVFFCSSVKLCRFSDAVTLFQGV